jgi:Xrn1 helical domain
MSFDFQLGTPFCPYEQLIGLLPLASKDHIPSAYHGILPSPRVFFNLKLPLLRIKPNPPILFIEAVACAFKLISTFLF